MDVRQIRDESIAAARKLGVHRLATLPLLDANLEMRALEESASRLLAMHPLGGAAYGFDKAKAIAWLNQEGLYGYLTDSERRFLAEGIGEPEPFQYQIEGMWALAWALGLARELDFAKDCDDRFALMFPSVKQHESTAEFRSKLNPRPLDEVVSALDLAYCLHWAIRDAEIHGKPPPGKLKPYVVIERRRAFEWLLSRDKWDEVMMDT